jgi:hypothetical protein
MLIDLGRNDIGRVSEVGSVKLTEHHGGGALLPRHAYRLQRQGKLQPGLGPMDVLRATFPAGTVSGAPKIRAMEIIDEVEPVKRGVYAGAVGYLSWSGNMDTAIAIRTAVIKDGQVHVQAGAGVVRFGAKTGVEGDAEQGPCPVPGGGDGDRRIDSAARLSEDPGLARCCVQSLLQSCCSCCHSPWLAR